MERRSIRRLAGLLGAVLLWGQATAQAAVTSLRVSTSPTKVRVVLDLDAPVTYNGNFVSDLLLYCIPVQLLWNRVVVRILLFSQ